MDSGSADPSAPVAPSSRARRDMGIDLLDEDDVLTSPESREADAFCGRCRGGENLRAAPSSARPIAKKPIFMEQSSDRGSFQEWTKMAVA